MGLVAEFCAATPVAVVSAAAGPARLAAGGRSALRGLERVWKVNERGTGSAQYHPRMMLALLVYCYANGIFGSRRIERATYPVRYVAANCHPDPTRSARPAQQLRSGSGGVSLLLAKELQLLRVGTVSVDGTKVDANANKRNSIRYDRAGALREQLRGEIEGLLVRRSTPTRTTCRPAGSAEELSRRDKLRAKLDGVGTACAGAGGLGAGGVRAQGGSAGAAYGIAQGSAHQAADGSAGGEGADQPDGRGQCADAQEPAP